MAISELGRPQLPGRSIGMVNGNAQEGNAMENALGLVMTGGGARGAYQACVLKRIGELPGVQSHGNPFPIIGAPPLAR